MVKRTRWVLLAYRLPHEPSTPRIAVWRQLRHLGVGHVSDGVVALPLDARTHARATRVARRNRRRARWRGHDLAGGTGHGGAGAGARSADGGRRRSGLRAADRTGW